MPCATTTTTTVMATTATAAVTMTMAIVRRGYWMKGTGAEGGGMKIWPLRKTTGGAMVVAMVVAMAVGLMVVVIAQTGVDGGVTVHPAIPC